jgi:hypothetical protein
MWRKWWLLFTVIWVVVTGIQVALILATSEETEKAVQPAVLGVAVPAALYFIGWLWTKLRP